MRSALQLHHATTPHSIGDDASMDGRLTDETVGAVDGGLDGIGLRATNYKTAVTIGMVADGMGFRQLGVPAVRGTAERNRRCRKWAAIISIQSAFISVVPVIESELEKIRKRDRPEENAGAYQRLVEHERVWGRP